jgi:hypothetical protein
MAEGALAAHDAIVAVPAVVDVTVITDRLRLAATVRDAPGLAGLYPLG